MSSFEAALNLLREQWRAVKDVRWTIINDHDLAKSDPGHRSDLLAQTQAEQGQLTSAIELLEKVEAGDLLIVDASAAAARPEPAPDPAAIDPRRVRQTGLIKRFVPEGRA